MIFDPDLEDDEDVSDGLAEAVDHQSALQDLEFLRARVARLVELREAKDRAKLAATKATTEFEQYQAEFYDEYEKSPLKGSISLDIGDRTIQIVPRKTRYGRILDRDKAIEYFTKRNKLNEYTRDDFRMGRLHELVREHIEQKKPLPEGIDFYTKEFFTITFKD